MNTLPSRTIGRDQAKAIVVLCSCALLGACASKSPDFGDRLIGEGGELSALGEDWQKGQSLVEKGRKLIARGEEEIADGRRHVAEGEAMLDRGLQMIERSEREYRVLERRQNGTAGEN